MYTNTLKINNNKKRNNKQLVEVKRNTREDYKL